MKGKKRKIESIKEGRGTGTIAVIALLEVDIYVEAIIA